MGGEVIGINTETFDENKSAIKEAASILESQGAKYRNLSIDSTSDAVSYTHLASSFALVGTAHSSEATSILPSASRNSCTKSAPVPYTQDERIMICLLYTSGRRQQ